MFTPEVLSTRAGPVRAQHSTLTACQAPGSEVRFPAEAPENVPDVVRRGHALLEPAVPQTQDSVDDLDAGAVQVVEGDVEPILVEDREVLIRGHVRGGSVEVRSCGRCKLGMAFQGQATGGGG